MANEIKSKLSVEKYAKFAAILEKTKWASEFSWDQIRIICQYIHPVSAKKGAIIFKEGDKEESLGIIVKGTIHIYKSNEADQVKVASLKSSQTFGEMALIDGEPRSATGIAAEDSVIFFISKKGLLSLSEEHPRLGLQVLWKVSKLISRHLRHTTGRLVDYM